MKGITDGIFLLNFLSFKAPEISENSEHKQQCWNYKVLVISFRSESRHLGNFQHHSYLHESIFFYTSSFCYFRIDTSICWRVFILTTSTITPKSKQGDTVTTSTTTKAKKKGNSRLEIMFKVPIKYKKIAFIWRENMWIFVRGYHLLQDANSLPRAKQIMSAHKYPYIFSRK